MGKGDKKSKKGKIWRGSYGNTRPRTGGTPQVVKKTKKTKAKTKKS